MKRTALLETWNIWEGTKQQRVKKQVRGRVQGHLTDWSQTGMGEALREQVCQNLSSIAGDQRSRKILVKPKALIVASYAAGEGWTWAHSYLEPTRHS